MQRGVSFWQKQSRFHDTSPPSAPGSSQLCAAAASAPDTPHPAHCPQSCRLGGRLCLDGPYCVRSKPASTLPLMTLVPPGFEKPTTFETPLTTSRGAHEVRGWCRQWPGGRPLGAGGGRFNFFNSVLRILASCGPFAFVHTAFSLRWVFLARVTGVHATLSFHCLSPLVGSRFPWLPAVPRGLEGTLGFCGDVVLPAVLHNLQQVALSPQFCRLRFTFAFFFRNLFTCLFGIMVF